MPYDFCIIEDTFMKTFFSNFLVSETVAASLFVAPIASQAAESYEVVVKGLGSVTFGRAGAKDATYTISYPNAGPFKGGIQRDEHKYVDYSVRMRLMREKKTGKLPPKTAYSNCVVWVRVATGIALLSPWTRSAARV